MLRQALHDREILDTWHMVHAKLDPHDDIVVDNIVVAGSPGLDPVPTTACTYISLVA
jgi:hypothetical protein